MPFTVENTQANYTPPSIFVENGFNPAGGAGNIMSLCTIGQTYMQYYTIASSAGNNYTGVSYNDLQTGSNRIRFSACYRAA